MSGRNTGQQALAAISGQLGKLVIQIAALVIFSRLLSPADLGLVAMCTAVVGIANVVGDMGLSLAAIQAPDLSLTQRSNLFWMNSGLGVSVGVVVAVVAPLVAAIYHDPRATLVVLWLSLIFALNGVAVQFRVELNRDYRMTTLAAVDASSQFVGLLVGILSGILGWGYWALIAQQIVAALVALILVVVFSSWVPGLPERGAAMGHLLRFGWHTFLTQIVTYVSSNIDTIMIGHVWGQGIVGTYSRAYQLAFAPAQQVASPLTRVLMPKLAAHATSVHDFARAARESQLILIYVVGGALSVLAGTAGSLVPVLLGSQWDASIVLVRVLAIDGVFTLAAYIFYWLLLAQARTRLLFYTELLARTVMSALIVAAAFLGPVWVAWAASFGGFLLALSCAVIALPRVGLPINSLTSVTLRPIALYSAAALVSWEAERYGSSAGGHLLGLVAGVASWLAVVSVVMLARPYRNDVQQVARRVATVVSRGPRKPA